MSLGDATLGGYTLEQPIARGRSGTVYSATSDNGTRVALKVYDRSEDAAREAACLRSFDHPGLIRLVDADIKATTSPWLALQWIDGMTLRSLLESSAPLPVVRTRAIVEGIADAVDAVHRAGFVHGDLAPSNVLVGPGDTVTLIDFAAAWPYDAPHPALDTTTGLELETTPRYASPEVALGQPAGFASDTYALALIAYEALTGRSPFPDVATPIAMLGHHASTEPDPPTEHRPDLPAGIEWALLRALAKEPADRPASAGAFAVELRNDAAPHGYGPARTRISPASAFGLVAVLIAVIGWFALPRGSERPADLSLPADASASARLIEDDTGAGFAANLSCNLISVTGFEDTSVPDSYYGGDSTNTIGLASGAGVSQTGALRVGSNGNYGVFGEIVPLGPDRDMVFSAWLRRQGNPDIATLYVDYLDADYDELTASRDAALSGQSVAQVATQAQGSRITILSEAPPNAAFAVPTFFKDGSGGSLLVDEVVFGPRSGCVRPGS